MEYLINSGKPLHYFISGSMLAREQKLKTSRLNADRVARDLDRERVELHRKEKHLMSQIRQLVKKGDYRASKRLASEIASLRKLEERNLDASCTVKSRAQAMLSNHRINRAHVEAIKGFSYVNHGETLMSVADRAAKYTERMEIMKTMEEMMNDSMDEIYDDTSDEVEVQNVVNEMSEIDSILREALDPHAKREYGEHLIDPTRTTYITLKRFHPTSASEINLAFQPGNSFGVMSPDGLSSRSDTACSLTQPPNSGDLPLFPSVPTNDIIDEHGVTMSLPTLEISFDMLKRLLAKDVYAVTQLGLKDNAVKTPSQRQVDAVIGSAKPFVMGKIRLSEQGETQFVPLDFTKSLRESGIGVGSTIWLLTLEDARRAPATQKK